MQIICTDSKIGHTFILWEADIQTNFLLVVKKEAWEKKQLALQEKIPILILSCTV